MDTGGINADREESDRGFNADSTTDGPERQGRRQSAARGAEPQPTPGPSAIQRHGRSGESSVGGPDAGSLILIEDRQVDQGDDWEPTGHLAKLRLLGLWATPLLVNMAARLGLAPCADRMTLQRQIVLRLLFFFRPVLSTPSYAGRGA
jgi:hypothetical protein